MSARSRNITFISKEQREADVRPLDFRLIRRLVGLAAAHPYHRNRLIVLVIMRAALLPTLSWTIGAVLGGPVSRMDMRGIVVGALGFALVAAVTQYSFRYRMLFALELGEKVIHDLRRDMFSHLQEMTMRFYNTTKIGSILSRFITDAEAVRVGVQDVLFVSIVGLGQMVVASLFMLWHDWVLYLILLCMAPVLWGVNRIFHARLSRAYRSTQESFSRITATLAESVKGIRVTQGFARAEVNADIFHDLLMDHSRYNLDAAKAAGVFLPLLEINSQIFIALVLLVGGWRVLSGAAAIEDLYQFVLMSAVFFSPIQNLGNQYNNSLSAMAGAERVFDFLDAKPDWTDPSDSVKLESMAGRIEFRNVSFEYEPGKPVLQDLSFVIEPGTTVALAGQTGSGKSSIVNLIAKFYLPTSGGVLIDGRDIREIDSTALHEGMGIVQQQNFLFSGTVADNILVGKPAAGMEEIAEAARRLDCYDILESLPDGLMTTVGEGGSGISLGQRQLICFTRAMLANPRIMILDEATSSVDTMTEARIQKALALLLKDRTSVVVAHRLSTIRHVERVFVLDQGRIVEQGSHRSLLRKRGVYAQLYRRFIT